MSFRRSADISDRCGAEMSGHIVILVNPAAGRGDRGALRRFVSALAGPARRIDIIESRGPEDIKRIAHDTVADYILIAGGDGSINEAVAGLFARRRPRPVLGIVPLGTVNVLAAELGLPRDLSALARAYLQNQVGSLRLGLANDRPFVLMASTGLDAQVVHAVRPGLKRIVGRAAYLIQACRLLLHRSPAFEIETDSGVFRSKLAIFAKASRYGGNFVVAPGMSVLRPGLRLIVPRDVKLSTLLRIAYSLLRGDLPGEGLIETALLRRARVTAASPIAIQIDGDPLGCTPLLLCEADEPLDILLMRERSDG